ncbi:NADH-quinone oxidoreductase subunit NuoE [Planctomycetota bacterium]
MKSEYAELFSDFKGVKHELIPLLQAAQGKFGYLSDESMETIAKFVGIPASRVYGVATFYAQFRFAPVGKHMVTVCRGTACHVKGAQRILEELERELGVKEGETTEDLEYTLETVACIGCCALAPCVSIDEDVKAQLTPKTATELFAKRR